MKISAFPSGKFASIGTPDESPKKTCNLRSILSATRANSDDTKDKGINYGDLRVVKRIDKGKCMIFLANSRKSAKKYALKVFPSTDPKKTSHFYKNEIRFRDLKHKNVIEMVGYKNRMEMILDGKKANASYIIMEYAPYKDFCQAILDYDIFEDDEVLVRTYFHQLIEALEYLHSQGVFHLDIKLDNLLLGECFQLKIADFDNSNVQGDEAIKSRGTKYYRAPEIARGKCENPAAADVYSVGVVLFAMKSGGFFPHLEDELFEGINFYDLFTEDHTEFWLKQCIVQQRSPKFFSPAFRELIVSMITINPKKRATLDDVKSSEWYNGPIYCTEELKEIMKDKFQKQPSSANEVE